MIHLKVKVAQSCPILCDPIDYTAHGILQPRILDWVAFPFSRGYSQPGTEPRSPALQADSLPAEPQGKPENIGVGNLSILQGVFPTQESNQGLQHCRWILYQLSYQGSPHSRQREQHIKGPMAERNMEPLRPSQASGWCTEHEGREEVSVLRGCQGPRGGCHERADRKSVV